MDTEIHEAGQLLLQYYKAKVWAHSQAVAAEAGHIARRFNLDLDACMLGALCHDIGCILTPAQMTDYAHLHGWELDPSEEKYPFLLHQRFSALFCREKLGILDDRILSAVGCHTTLKADASMIDMAVFLADKLSWDQDGSPPYASCVYAALEESLPAGCLAQIDYTIDNGMILMPHRQLLEAHVWLNDYSKRDV